MAAAIPAPFSLGDALQLTLAQACLLANVFIASYTLRAVHTNLSFAVPGVLLFCASLAWFGNSEAGLGLGGVVLFCLSFFWMRPRHVGAGRWRGTPLLRARVTTCSLRYAELRVTSGLDLPLSRGR